MSGKILILDDDRFLCRILEDFSEEFGFDAQAVTRVPEAKRLVAEGGFDVAIVDLHLPVISGFDFLEWLQTEAPTVIPVVLSGTSSIEEAVKAVRENAFDFVIKPVEDYDAFFQRIQRAVDFKRLRESRDRLLAELREKNDELANRVEQLTLAHRTLQNHAKSVAFDLDRARRIQQGLLPKRLPFPDRVAMSVLFRPVAKVGGDLYDVFRIDEKVMAVYVADVCGHGVSAAMLTVFLKDAVHSIDRELGATALLSPDSFLAELNRRLIEEVADGDVFISMTYLVIDTTTYEVKASSAGHPPLLIRRGDGRVETHHGLAPALGISGEAEFEARRFHLEAEDRVLLFSDGIREIADEEGHLFGDQRLVEVFSGLEDRADEVAEKLGEAFDRFCRTGVSADDVTLLCLGAEKQERPFRGEEAPPVHDVTEAPAEEHDAELRHGERAGHFFVQVVGAGTWKLADPFRRLCGEARDQSYESLILDLETCPHLDSTFMGILHETVAACDETHTCRFEIQNPGRSVLREMGELGLRDVLHHVRIQPLVLPDHLGARAGRTPNPKDMSQLLIKAHESLVKADSGNADRFDKVLRVLSGQGSSSES